MNDWTTPEPPGTSGSVGTYWGGSATALLVDLSIITALGNLRIWVVDLGIKLPCFRSTPLVALFAAQLLAQLQLL